MDRRQAQQQAKGKRPKWTTQDDRTAVMALVHRESGEVRSQVVPNVTGSSLRAVIEANVDLRESELHTDQAKGYLGVGPEAKAHQTVNHEAWEYVRDGVTTNHAEGYFSQLKRSIDGTHHHVSVEHLPRYLAEFDFRATTHEATDSQRMRTLMGRTGGRRLTYKPLTGTQD